VCVCASHAPDPGSSLPPPTNPTTHNPPHPQVVVLEELASLKSAMAAEREERVAEDDEIIMAVNDYTKALQDGLRIVANT